MSLRSMLARLTPLALLPVLLIGTPASAATSSGLEGFDPGMIISDEAFYNSSALSASQIEAFLEERGASCVPAADGTPCLNDYTADTPAVAATSYCAAITAVAGNTSAGIIAAVAQACGINPQVFLVLLQKEQGLVTASGGGLTATRYARATGAGCPDFQNCDSSLGNFFRQIYGAGERFQKYRAHPDSYNHQAGQTEQIAYSPEPSCGAAAVTVRNQATAGLYNYTPFVPNQAALDAGAALGDACSAYGNRNFYRYFKLWFPASVSSSSAAPLAAAPAATLTTSLTAVVAKAAEFGSASTGAASGPMLCGLAAAGCFKPYAEVRVYWTPSLGAWSVRGAIRDHWADEGWENGPLGYPTSDEQCVLRDDGCYQAFENGLIYHSPATGTWSVSGGILDLWADQGWEEGDLGYPIGDATPTGEVTTQAFEGGTLTAS